MNRLNIQRGAGVVAIVAAFLPWVTLGPFSVSGTGAADSDGWIMVALGAIVIAVTFWKGHRVAQAATAIIAGGVMAGDAIRVMHTISGVPTNPLFGGASAGSGVILTLLSGATLIGVALAIALGVRNKHGSASGAVTTNTP